MAETDLVLVNDFCRPTFIRENYSSVLDLTMVTPGLYKFTTGWQVLEEEPLSDHKYIMFGIKSSITCTREQPKLDGWQVRKLDKEKFNQFTDNLEWNGEINSGNFSSKLREICNATMPTRKISRNGRPVYWRTTEIAVLRSECVQKRRLYTRAVKKNNLSIITQTWINYQNNRKRLRDEIKKAKKLWWNKLADEIDRDIWGDGYKIA